MVTAAPPRTCYCLQLHRPSPLLRRPWQLFSPDEQTCGKRARRSHGPGLTNSASADCLEAMTSGPGQVLDARWQVMGRWRDGS